MKIRYILFTSLRYFKARRKSKGFASSLLSILGVTVGVMTLTYVLAVMNGFQLNYINNILEISSYHLQITHQAGLPLDEKLTQAIKKMPEVETVVPFAEDQVLIEGFTHQLQGGIVRGVPADITDRDASFKSRIFGQKRTTGDTVDDKFNVSEPFSVMIGTVLASFLRVQEGDYITLSSVSDISFDESATKENRFKVAGIFKSGYNEIDKNLLFVSLETAELFFPEAVKQGRLSITYGIKLHDHFADLEVVKKIEQLIENNEYTVKSWREFNKGFFGALLMEKIMMMFLVGLIFIVVGFNVLNSLRRMVYERIEEIGLLKAIGSSPGEIQYIFIFEGFLIGFVGGLLGMVLGLLVANHINEIFDITVAVINFCLEVCETLVSPFAGVVFLGRMTSPFSPNVFYLKEVPSQVLLFESFIIFLFALCSSVVAAFIASKKVARVKPIKVLRYE
jgi:lipoprotein-releasing system permease protein